MENVQDAQGVPEGAQEQVAVIPHRTFKGTVACDFKMVVSDQFIQEMREHSRTEHASPGLKAMVERHPTNDEAFIEQVLSNGLRVHYRNCAAELIGSTEGIGGTLSPATVVVYGVPSNWEAQAVPDTLTRPGPV